MMGKPNTLEEQEEQKKREAESFFAQKDSGTNREKSEVTPPTPPKSRVFGIGLLESLAMRHRRLKTGSSTQKS